MTLHLLSILPVLAGFIMFTLFIAIALYLLYTSIKNRNQLPVTTKKYIQAKWLETKELANKNAKEAIIQADKILDHTLTKMGATGTVSEKLMHFEHRFTNFNLITQAHRLRNKIVHDLDFKPKEADLQKNLNYFEQALHDLDIFKI